MNWLDIVLILILAWSLVAAFRRGFSREVFGLVSSILAFLAGLWFYGSAGAPLSDYTSSRTVANFCGFLIVFAGVLLAGALLGFALGRLIKFAGLSWFDRILGSFFGLVRGVVIAIALVTVLVAFTPGEGPPASVVRSRVAPYVVDAAHVFSSLAPLELKQEFGKRFDQVKKMWNRTVRKGVRELPGSDI